MVRVTKKAVEEKRKELEILDRETQSILREMRRKDRRARSMSIALFLVLFIIGITGILYQNKLATQNKDHIDCIIKLLATPSKPGQVRRIVDLTTCGIQVK